MEVHVDLSGLEALLRRVPSALDKAATAAAEVFHEEATRTVPIDDGDLKRSGKVVEGAPSLHEPAVHVASVEYGDEKAPYAYHVHENTGEGGRSGKPWLRDAMTAKVGQARKAAGETLAEELGR